MQGITYLAGWPACSQQQQTYKTIGKVLGLALFVGLSILMLKLFKLVNKSALNQGFKIGLFVFLGLLALPVCVLVPFLVAFLITPWCS